MNPPQVKSLPLLLLAVLAATAMDAVNGTALSLAGSQAMGDLRSTPDAFALTDLAYVGARLAGFPAVPWIAARLGWRRSLAGAILLIAAGSLGCTVVSGLAPFALLRALQGIGGAFVLVLGQAALFESFPQRRQVAIQATFALAAVMLPNTLAPWIEGWLTDNLTWPWIFAVDLPLAAFALAALWSGTRADPPAFARRTRLAEIAGISLLAIGVPCLVFVLQRGERWDWFADPLVAASSCIAAVALGGFVVHHWRGRGALVDVALFRNPDFAFGFAVSFVAGAALYGSGFLIPAFAVSVLGYPAARAGALLAPSGAAIALGLLVASAAIQLRGIRPLAFVPLGIGLFMVAMWMFAGSTSQSGGPQLSAPLALRGFGLGLLFLALTLLMLSGLRGAHIAHGVALFNVGRQLGGLAGVAVLQHYVDWHIALDRSVLGQHFASADPAFAERMGALAEVLAARGLDAAQALGAATALTAHALQRQLAVLAFDDAFLIVALLFVAAAPVLFGIKLAQRHRAVHAPRTGFSPAPKGDFS
ncbi:MAG: MFS transporter [Burkholderiales bacterium]